MKDGSKRFLTLHGVPVPPWREVKGFGTPIRFVITGPVPSKKNNQQAVAVRKQAFEFIDDLIAKHGGIITPAQAKAAIKKVHAKMRGNDAYREFLDLQRPLIEAQRNFWMQHLHDKGLIFPISQANLSIRFYFAQKYRQDSVNKQQSVQDLLKDCLVISDDDYSCINPIKSDAQLYHDEIRENITVATLMVDLKK